MTKITHTPGPWSLDPIGTKAGRNKFALRSESHRICDVPVYSDMDIATARLIAAAPDLLAALRDMVANYVETYGDEGDDAPATVKAALAAIAKVEG